MARLPIPGSDDGTWGDVLNDYLAVVHNTDGTLKTNAVDAGALQVNSVSGTKLQDGSVSSVKLQDNSVTSVKLNAGAGSDGQVLTKNASAGGGLEWSSAPGVPDATPTTKGLVQLAGDLAGTATSPTVPGLATKVNTSTTVSAGTGLTGGGDLSTNRTLSANFGTTAGTIAAGDDSRITGAIQATIVDAKGDILAATAADTVTRLGIGSDGQVLTADSAQTTGLRWATPSAGGGSGDDIMASRWGCKTMTFFPHSLNQSDPQTLRMVEQRLYASWLALPAGTTITGVRLPIQDNLTAAGSLWFTVYQDDGTQLGTTGDVSADFTAGTGETWRSANLTAPAVTTGDGVWVTSLGTVAQASSLSLLFCDITTPTIPLWLFDGKAQYTDGIATPPATYNSAGGLQYFDILIGLY
jgi:hypothetical protein